MRVEKKTRPMSTLMLRAGDAGVSFSHFRLIFKIAQFYVYYIAWCGNSCTY